MASGQKRKERPGPSRLLSAEEDATGKEEHIEPIMCRLCKGQGWGFRPGAQHESQTMECTLCKGQGQLDPRDVDEWTFADLDEPLGPGAIGAQPPRVPYVPPTAEWRTWMDDEDGRGYLWAELVVPDKEKSK